MDVNRTVPRKIRLYPHEWADVDRVLKKLNKGRKRLIGANRLFAYYFDSEVTLDPLDIEAHTEEAKNKNNGK